jgi:hypothetical protein
MYAVLDEANEKTLPDAQVRPDHISGRVPTVLFALSHRGPPRNTETFHGLRYSMPVDGSASKPPVKVRRVSIAQGSTRPLGHTATTSIHASGALCPAIPTIASSAPSRFYVGCPGARREFPKDFPADAVSIADQPPDPAPTEQSRPPLSVAGIVLPEAANVSTARS